MSTHNTTVDTPKRNLDEKQVAEIYKISTKTLQQWRWRGCGPAFIKLGRAVRYRPDDVNRFLEQNRVEAREETRAGA